MMFSLRPGEFVLLAVLLGASGCSTEPQVYEEPGTDEHGHKSTEHGAAHERVESIVELAPEAVARIGLATTVVSRRTLDETRVTTGEIGFDQNRLAHVGPRVSGRLWQVQGELGEKVTAGETLALVDSIDVGSAKAAFLRARARAEVAARRFERERSLRADRIVSEQAVLEAEADARETAADLAAAREALRLLGLGGDEEIDALSWGEPGASLVPVRAPFAGTIVAREATMGELVDPRDTLFTIADLSEVWLWLDLFERDLAHVVLEQRVEVRLDAWPGETFAGELGYIADQLERQSRTVRARVELANPQGRFKPGMFAQVALVSGSEGDDSSVLAVPRSAVQRDGDESVAFVRVGPGRFERREVEVGRTSVGLAEIVSGLAAGDEVVTVGAFLLLSQASADQLGGHHH